jgi:hypothetical protein
MKRASKAIIYIDAMNNRIVCRNIDKEELEKEYDGDIFNYAEDMMPSNTCEWMAIDDKTQIICNSLCKKYLYVETENGKVEFTREFETEEEAIEHLKAQYDYLNDEEKELQPWDEVEIDLMFEYWNKYGDKIVCQIMEV